MSAPKPPAAGRFAALAAFAGPAPGLAFVGGVWLLQQTPALPSLALAFVILAALSAACRPRRWRRPALLLLLAAIGFFYAAGRADLRLRATLPDDLIWRDLQAEGVVIGAPVVRPDRTRFDFAISRVISPRPFALNLRVRLWDYHRGGAPLAKIAEGAKLRLRVRLRPPEGAFNPHGFDYAGHLFARDIRLVGYARDRGAIEALEGGEDVGFRRRTGERIRAAGARQPALLRALVIGDRGDIDEDGWRVLRRTGTAHLVTVSGAHIGFVYILIAAAVGLLWRFSLRLSRRAPAAQVALLAALPPAFAYAWLAGLGVPAQRSFMMLAIAALVVVAGGVRSTATALTAAMVAIVVINPWAVVSAGFWLSFALTGVLLFVAVAAPPGSGWARRLLTAQLAASLFAAPLTLWFFNEASLASPLANLVAVPVVGLAALPLALTGIFAGDFCWIAAGWLLDILWRFLEFLSALPLAAWSPAQAPAWLFALAVGGCCWLLMPRGVPLRAAGLAPIVAMLLFTPSPPAAGEFRMTVLDVGQGGAVVLRTAGHALAYDAGRAHGGRVVADYLRGVGARRLDVLLISHDDYDHRGGAAALRANFPVGEVIASDGDSLCRRGRRWRWDDVEFSIAHPREAATADADNDDSCVLIVRAAGGETALLVGDISAAVERRLAPDLPPATILHVAHHGSRFSSDAEFLRHVRPQIAVISVGRNNYGHPHEETLGRLRRAGADVYRTDAHGAVAIDVGDEVRVRAWRERRRRYWHEGD